MATVIPSNITHFASIGEQCFCQFLRDVLKPDSQCFAWHSLLIEGVEPDFVVYTPEVGLVVFEVKDWSLESIKEADQQRFTLVLDQGREEVRANPLKQVIAYRNALMDRIKCSCAQLLSSDPYYRGKAKVPVECAVVFTNITREAYCRSALHSVLPIEKILFADDLTLAAATMGDNASRTLRDTLAAMLPPRFDFNMSDKDVGALRDVLWPRVRIVIPKRAGQTESPDADETIRRLDAQQESLARRLDARRALLHGPAGSGKTLVLAHKAVQELHRLRQSGSDLPVLLVCYNLTLVHYLKRLLAAQQAPLGRNGIRVTHFYDFCRSLLAEPLSYENEDVTYYALVTQMALEAASGSSRYGAIFVDEGQDFSDAMMAVLHGACAQDALFWVACDTAQNLYETEQQWLADDALRRFSLSAPYRATQCLTTFCEAMMPRKASGIEESTAPPDVFSIQALRGEWPNLQQVNDLRQGVAYIVQRIRALHEQGVPHSEMMVLYASSKHHSLPDGSVPEFLRDALEENGILVAWLSRNAQSKSAWDITTDSVSLSTIHSMKGLDAKAVFVWGLDSPGTGPRTLKNQRALAYVAFTRARQYLDVVFCERTPFITELAQTLSRLSLAKDNPQ